MQIALQSTSSIAIEDVTWSPKEDDEIGKRTIGWMSAETEKKYKRKRFCTLGFCLLLMAKWLRLSVFAGGPWVRNPKCAPYFALKSALAPNAK